MDNADNRDVERCSQLLNGGKTSLAALLPVKRDHQASNIRARRIDNLVGFANSGSGGDDVINNEYFSSKFCANNATAFPMRLGLFSVVGKWNINSVVLGESRCRECGERNTFVGRAEYHVELDARFGHGGCVKASEFGGGITRVK